MSDLVRRVTVDPGAFDPEGIFAVLAAHDVDYVLIGGLAAVLRGAAVDTIDVDVAVADEEVNLDRAATALRELQARLLVSLDPDGLHATIVDLDITAQTLRDVRPTRLWTRCGIVDLVHDAAAVGGHDGWVGRADEVDLGDVVVVVASLEDLIASKRAADRPKDRRALPFLEEALRQLRDRDGS